MSTSTAASTPPTSWFSAPPVARSASSRIFATCARSMASYIACDRGWGLGTRFRIPGPRALIPNRLQAGRLAQRVGLVGALPGRVDILAAEVAVGGCGAVDWPAQPQVADDRARPQVEVLVDQP